MIEMKDFIATMQKQLDSYILDETSGKIQQITMSVAVDVYDKEKCKEWIKQAIEIETFTEEQITDLKIKHWFDKKNEEIKQMRKKICDEIKEKVIANSCLDNKEQLEYWNDEIDLRTLFEFIDQVEMGE